MSALRQLVSKLADEVVSREGKLVAEIRKAYSRSRGESDDASRFCCARCYEWVSADEGGTDMPGLCESCWSAVHDLIEDEGA